MKDYMKEYMGYEIKYEITPFGILAVALVDGRRVTAMGISSDDAFPEVTRRIWRMVKSLEKR